MSEDVKMSAAAAARINDQFDNLSAEFDNTRTYISSYADKMLAGAGELSGSMETGAGTFDISWRDTFEVCSTSAALIAGNTNQFSIDLSRLDKDNAWAITL